MIIDKNKILVSIDDDVDIDDNGLCTIPFGVKAISKKVFTKCEKLERVMIPNSVEHIGEAAFAGCINLSSINFPNTLKTIADYAFSECTSLTSINFPKSILSIGLDAFYSCVGLESISFIDGSDVVLSAKAFESCHGLKKVKLPQGLKTIPKGCFAFSSLESIDIPSSVEIIETVAFWNCCDIKNIVIPENVKVIENSAFGLCKSLESVTFSGNIEEIGSGAFQHSKLKVVKAVEPKVLTEDALGVNLNELEILKIDKVKVSESKNTVEENRGVNSYDNR